MDALLPPTQQQADSALSAKGKAEASPSPAYRLSITAPLGEEEGSPPNRGPLLFGYIAIALFLGGFFLWSALAPLSEAAIAPGMIKVEGTRRTVQHLEGGIVREILVRDGDRVSRGQVLLRLDDIRAAAELETLRSQRWVYLAHDARLSAEIERAAEITFPPALLSARDARAVEAIAVQRAVFTARQESLASQIAVQEARIGQQEAIIAAASGQLRSLRRQQELIRQEEEMTEILVRQGLQRLPTLLALRRAAAALDGQEQELKGQIERAERAIAEARSAIATLINRRREEAAVEQREVRLRLAEAEERIRAAEDVALRREILAPESGTVINLRVFTVGAVIRPGDAILDIVPAEDRLVAEVNIPPIDIDSIHVGQRAEIRLLPFKQRTVPLLDGVVTFVAEDITLDERSRAAYYRAHILLNSEQLARLPEVQLVPGMPVEAFIHAGERSFLRYLVQPIRDSFRRAFREP